MIRELAILALLSSQAADLSPDDLKTELELTYRDAQTWRARTAAARVKLSTCEANLEDALRTGFEAPAPASEEPDGVALWIAITGVIGATALGVAAGLLLGKKDPSVVVVGASP